MRVVCQPPAQQTLRRPVGAERATHTAHAQLSQTARQMGRQIAGEPMEPGIECRRIAAGMRRHQRQEAVADEIIKPGAADGMAGQRGEILPKLWEMLHSPHFGSREGGGRGLGQCC